MSVITRFDASIEFIKIDCGACGFPFYVPTKWQETLVESKRSFRCPTGCSLSYTKSTSEKLSEQLEDRKNEILRLKSLLAQKPSRPSHKKFK